MIARLLRYRWLYLSLLLLLTGWLGSYAAQVDVERDNESLNTFTAAESQAYAELLHAFGSDDDLVLAVADPRLLSPTGLDRIDRLTGMLATIDGVAHVFSLTNAVQLVHGPDGAEDAPLIARPWDTPARAADAERALDRNPDFTGLLVSADRRTAGIIIQLEQRENDTLYREHVIRSVRAAMAAEGSSAVTLHLSGIAVQIYDVGELVRRDQAVLVPIAIGVLGLMLAFSFRSPIGVLLPLSVMGISVVATLGVYGIVGLRVNAITALLPPILMVLTLTATVHLLQAWTRDLDAPREPIARIQAIVQHLLFPCFYCALTSAIGFASLATSDMPAVRQFGLFAALGVTISFVVAMTLVPVGLSFLPAPTPTAERDHPLDRLLASCGELVVRHPYAIWAVFGAVTAVSLLGLPYVRNNTDLVRFLKADAPLFRDTMFIDEHLTGVNTIDLVVHRHDGAPLVSLGDVRRLAEL